MRTSDGCDLLNVSERVTEGNNYTSSGHQVAYNDYLEILPAGVRVQAFHGDAVLRAARRVLGPVRAVATPGLHDDPSPIELAAVHLCKKT